MHKIVIAIFFLVFSQIAVGQAAINYEKIFSEKLDIEKHGSSIVAVFVDEKGTRFVSSGKRSKSADSVAADEKTIYEIGSITKLFVGVLLADAISRGEVNLDAPISEYLPKTVKIPKFKDKEITLLDLATHSSSLPRLPNNFTPKNNLDPYADFTAEHLYEFLSKYKLEREIGSEYEYSNLGMGLLGHILSLRAKMPFEQLLTKRIFIPLGMNDTSLSLPPDKKVRHAQGFNEADKSTAPWFFDSLAGAGAIRSTTADMAKFIGASVGLTKTPLSSAFVEARKMRRQGQNPKVKIGLGWNNVDLDGNEVFWHGGGTYGFSSYIAVDPIQKKGAFLVHNSGQPTGSVFLESVAFNYLQPKMPIKQPVPPKTEIALAEDVLEKYVGEYQIAPTFSITVTRQGKQLFAQATGQGRFELFAEEEDNFFAKVAAIVIAFKKDGEGKVTELIISQSGNDTVAKKIK